jgi:DNA-binding transcriptional MerR regulator
MALLTSRELSIKHHVGQSTIRFWASKGLLQSVKEKRRNSTVNLYDEEAVLQIKNRATKEAPSMSKAPVLFEWDKPFVELANVLHIVRKKERELENKLSAILQEAKELEEQIAQAKADKSKALEAFLKYIATDSTEQSNEINETKDDTLV